MNADRLVEDNLNLVPYMVNRIQQVHFSDEDMKGFGYLGLVKAAQTYDPGRKVKFSTYACTCIRQEILNAIRKHQRNNPPAEVSMECPLQPDGSGTLADFVGHRDDFSGDLDYRMDLLEALGDLDDLELDVIRRYYGLGRKEETNSYIARQFGTSTSSVSRIHRRAIKKLRRRMKAG